MKLEEKRDEARCSCPEKRKRRGEVLLTSCHCGEMIRCFSKSLILTFPLSQAPPSQGGDGGEEGDVELWMRER